MEVELSVGKREEIDQVGVASSFETSTFEAWRIELLDKARS